MYLESQSQDQTSLYHLMLHYHGLWSHLVPPGCHLPLPCTTNSFSLMLPGRHSLCESPSFTCMPDPPAYWAESTTFMLHQGYQFTSRIRKTHTKASKFAGWLLNSSLPS